VRSYVESRSSITTRRARQCAAHTSPAAKFIVYTASTIYRAACARAQPQCTVGKGKELVPLRFRSGIARVAARFTPSVRPSGRPVHSCVRLFIIPDGDSLPYIDAVPAHAVRGYAAAPRRRGDQVTPTRRDEQGARSALTSASPPRPSGEAPAACKHRGIRDTPTCGLRCSCGRPSSVSCRHPER